MRPLLIALQFLTCLPVSLGAPPRSEELGRSLLWYPAVGLLLGLLLWALAAALQSTQPLLRAALALAAWVLMTGALHIDGLADCADAWIGGRGDRERMLAIMKDPYSGPVAVAAVVLVLLLKFAALDALLADGRSSALLLAPLLARTAMLPLFLSTPYLRAQGLGSSLAAQQPRRTSIVVLVLACLAAVVAYRTQAGLALGAAAVIFIGLRHTFMRRLGGFTGDCAGAMIELIETGVLLTAALLNVPAL